MTSLDKAVAHGAELQRQIEVLSDTNAQLRSANESLVLAGARYLALHDLAPTPLVTVDLAGVISDVNHAAEVLFGRGRSELIGERFSAFVDEALKVTIAASLRVLFAGGTLSDADVTLVHGGVPLEIVIDGVVLPDKGPPHALLACVDVTEQRLAEAARRSAAKRLEEVQRLESLGILAGGIAHDFNNLMTVVLIGTESVLDDLAATSGSRDSLVEVQAAARHAAELAKQMLAYSGRVSVPVLPVDLAALVRDLEPRMRASAQPTPVVLELTDRLVCIAGDDPQLRQAVLNLVVNAAEAMVERPGAITIAVRASADPSAAGPTVRAMVEVIDGGIGMSPETTSRIFDPYFSTKFAGRGLGLAVVHGVVRAHGGVIDVASAPGRGTTVRMTFPMIPELPAPVGPPPEVAARGRGTVLVVDDEEYIRTALSRTIRKLGIAVVVAASGDEALAILREQPGGIDLVMTDLTMPGMSGVVLARAIRALYADLPIILVTGYGELPVDSAHVFTSAIPKPFDLSTLRAALQQLLPARS